MPPRNGPRLTEALSEFDLYLRVANRSPATRQVYGTAVRQLADHLSDPPLGQVTKGQVSSYLASVLDTKSASTAVTRWGGLLAFFKWAKTEGLIRTDPMTDLPRPQQEQKVVPVVTDDDVRRLLESCAGKGFAEIRDTALIRMLVTTGLRRSEIAGLRVQDVDIKAQTAIVMGKGRRERIVRLEDRTALAIVRYLRARAERMAVVKREGREWAATDMLWIGKGGVFADTGIDQMLRRRGKALGIESLHAHRFRHTFAHRWLSKGGTEGGLMSQAGWRSRQMLGRYAASAASERSLDEHTRLGIGSDL